MKNSQRMKIPHQRESRERCTKEKTFLRRIINILLYALLCSVHCIDFVFSFCFFLHLLIFLLSYHSHSHNGLWLLFCYYSLHVMVCFVLSVYIFFSSAAPTKTIADLHFVPHILKTWNVLCDGNDHIMNFSDNDHAKFYSFFVNNWIFRILFISKQKKILILMDIANISTMIYLTILLYLNEIPRTFHFQSAS